MTSDTDGRGLGSGGILRRAWLPALCGLLLGGLLYAALSGRGPSYETCANLRINSASIDQAVLGLPAADKPITNLIGETAGEIEQARVAKRAVRYLGGRPFTDPDDLLDNIAAKPDPNTGFIGVCAKGDSPREAQRIANAVSRAYVDLNREDQRANLRAARRELRVLQRARVAALRRQAPGTAGRDAIADAIETSKDQISRLTLAERINTDTVSVATPADLPGGAAGIPPWTIGFLGFILGAALTAAVLAVRELTDGRIRSRGELAHVTGVPVLASVRRRRTLKRRRPLDRLRRREAEPFRLLLARLCNATGAADRRTVVIASVAEDGTGSSVCWYLSATAAAAGARVLLLEADPDRPSALDGGEGRPAGASDILAGRATLDEVVYHVAATERHAVDVLSPGERAPDAQLRGDAIGDLLARARSDYDHVFIDTAPVTEADAVSFVGHAEGAVLVCRRGGHRDPLRAACQQLAATGTPLLGVVAVGFLR